MKMGKGWNPSGRAPRCRRCGEIAVAKTPGGLRCLSHAMEEFASGEDPTWAPLLLTRATPR
jgi:hypothetical protein